MLYCPQVIVSWAVVQGARSNPEQPNRTAAYQASPYVFTVRR